MTQDNFEFQLRAGAGLLIVLLSSVLYGAALAIASPAHAIAAGILMILPGWFVIPSYKPSFEAAREKGVLR